MFFGKTKHGDEITLIKNSEFWDEQYYLSQKPDLKGYKNPIEHYLLIGYKEGFDPCENFSTEYYLANNADVAAANTNPLVHYLRNGIAEGRKIKVEDVREEVSEDYLLIKESGLFDEAYYLKQSPDIAQDETPIDHYIQRGYKEGLSPSRDFSSSGYYDCNPDVGKLGVNPLLHYLKFGKAESRRFIADEGFMFREYYYLKAFVPYKLKLAYIPSKQCFLNVLVDGNIDLTVLLSQAIAYCDNYGFALRIVYTDDIAVNCLSKLKEQVNFGDTTEFVYLRKDDVLFYSENDVFVASSYLLCMAIIRNRNISNKVIYLYNGDDASLNARLYNGVILGSDRVSVLASSTEITATKVVLSGDFCKPDKLYVDNGLLFVLDVINNACLKGFIRKNEITCLGIERDLNLDCDIRLNSETEALQNAKAPLIGYKDDKQVLELQMNDFVFTDCFNNLEAALNKSNSVSFDMCDVLSCK